MLTFLYMAHLTVVLLVLETEFLMHVMYSQQNYKEYLSARLRFVIRELIHFRKNAIKTYVHP